MSIWIWTKFTLTMNSNADEGIVQWFHNGFEDWSWLIVVWKKHITIVLTRRSVHKIDEANKSDSQSHTGRLIEFVKTVFAYMIWKTFYFDDTFNLCWSWLRLLGLMRLWSPSLVPDRENFITNWHYLDSCAKVYDFQAKLADQNHVKTSCFDMNYAPANFGACF